MTTTLRVHFDGKVLVPEEPVDLPVGESFDADLHVAAGSPSSTSLQGAADFIRQLDETDPVPGGPTDLATQVDHYLYGSKKRP